MKQLSSPLSEKTKEIILGSLLGDGSLKIHPGYANARFSFRHSIRQKEYFFWKVSQLQEIAGEKSVWKQGTRSKPDGWGSVKFRFQSKALPELTELHHKTHRGNHKTIKRSWLNKLTARSLFVWWCDDGSLVKNTSQGVLCTDGFTYKEVQIIDRYMKKVWGISTKIGRVAHQDQYRLWIRSRTDLKKFMRIILPYCEITSVLPKVLLLYRDSQLQQRWISEVSAVTGFSESVLWNVVQERKGSLKNFRE